MFWPWLKTCLQHVRWSIMRHWYAGALVTPFFDVPLCKIVFVVIPDAKCRATRARFHANSHRWWYAPVATKSWTQQPWTTNETTKILEKSTQKLRKLDSYKRMYIKVNSDSIRDKIKSSRRFTKKSNVHETNAFFKKLIWSKRLLITSVSENNPVLNTDNCDKKDN